MKSKNIKLNSKTLFKQTLKMKNRMEIKTFKRIVLIKESPR
jgi:hypothetical protein